MFINYNKTWAGTDPLRNDYKPSDYGKTILPFTVLRQPDGVLTQGSCRTSASQGEKYAVVFSVSPHASGLNFYNISDLATPDIGGLYDWLRPNGAKRSEQT